MKKMIALVLALVMTLSLLPMNVWAVDGGGGEGGGTPNSVGSPSDISSPTDQPLYWKYSPNDAEWFTGQLSESFGGSSWLYLVTDENGTPLANDWAVLECSSGIGTFSKANDGRLCWDHSGVRVGANGTVTITSGGATYTIPVSIGPSPIRVYIANEEKFADFENCYTYKSGSNVAIEFKVNDDMSITGVAGIDNNWFSIDTGKTSATLTIPSGASGRQEFQVFYNWLDGDGNPRDGERYFQFRDTKDDSDLFCRAVWGTNKDSWENGRFGGVAGEQMTLEFALPPQGGGWPADDAMMSLEEATVTVSENLGTATISGNQVLWDCTRLIPGMSGALKITKDGATYNVPVVITLPLVSVYSDEPDYNNLGENYMVFDQNRFYTYVPGASEPQVFYLLARERATFNGTPDQWPDGFAIVENSNGRLATYTIPAGSYGRKDITINVLQTWDGGSQENDCWIGFTEAERHNNVVGVNGLISPQKYDPVPIGDTGYFIGPGFLLYGVLKPMNGGWQVVHEGGQIDNGFAVGIWKLAPDGVTLELLEGQELNTVVARFNDTLKMDVKLVAENNDANREYPFVREITKSNDKSFYDALVDPNKYPLANIYTYTQYSVGTWCYIVTGTYTDSDGTEIPITAYGRDEKRLEKIMGINIPAQSSPEATVAYINEKLQEFSGVSDTNFLLDVGLPAGELRGYIKVPDDIYGVNFWGMRGSNNKLLTTLEGGIVANNFDTRVCCIRFEGAGRDAETWANEWDGSTALNKAFYGMAGGGAVHCSFTGYDCAIEMLGGVIGAGGMTDEDGNPLEETGSFFYDNNVAVKMNIENLVESGDSQYWKTVMVNNGTDFDFERTNGWGLGVHDTIFVRNDNNNSIHNTGGNMFFMPMLAFANSKNDGNNGNHDPKVDGNVSIAPYYTLTAAGKQALITDLKDPANVEAMLANPIYKEEWVSEERSFPRSWICPANPNKKIYSVPSDEITEEEMTIDIVGNEGYVGTIKLKKD